MNRSALIRRALEEHRVKLPGRELEARDRRGYEACPQRLEEYQPWEEVAEWPAD